jgi:hypothetical protein
MNLTFIIFWQKLLFNSTTRLRRRIFPDFALELVNSNEMMEVLEDD